MPLQELGWRLVRRIVLGDAARDDRSATEELTRLRADANWAYLKPRRRRAREAYHRKLRGYRARFDE
jgi:hypothetical protein